MFTLAVPQTRTLREARARRGHHFGSSRRVYMKWTPNGIVARSLGGLLLASLVGTTNIGVSLAEVSHFPTSVANPAESYQVSSGQASEDPEPIGVWWALLDLWLAINCQIVICETEIDPLMPIAAMVEVAPATVVATMSAQIAQYNASGIRSGLTQQQKEQGILDLEQTAAVIQQHPEELPTQVCGDYMLMIVSAIEDLKQ